MADQPRASVEVETGTLVLLARDGEHQALDSLLSHLTPRLYSLAMRFLFEPADAEDATQEALIRIARGIRTFRGESTVETWAYRIMTNVLRSTRRATTEALTVESGIEGLREGLAASPYDAPDAVLLEQEVQVACTTSLLVCLSRPLRLAYIIGEILEFDGPTAARILDITPATLRKRLQLARAAVRDFFRAQCGLADPTNPCRCRRQVEYSMRDGWLLSKRGGPYLMAERVPIEPVRRRLDGLIDEVALYRAQGLFEVPQTLPARIRTLVTERVPEFTREAVFTLEPLQESKGKTGTLGPREP